MKRALDSLGYAHVYRHPRSGELVVDTDTLRRGRFDGDDFGADPDYGDDIGDEEDDEDEFGDELGDDDIGDDVGADDDFGARGRGRRRRRARRQGRRERRRDRRGGSSPRRREQVWGMTAVGGTDTVADAAGGAATVKIRLQHDFRAQDITFTGSASGAKVTSIFFGDRVVWSNSDGIDAAVFASASCRRPATSASR
jgi:hypothetical protein